MKISYNWLKEYVDFDLSPQELADRLTIHGLEVDEVVQVGSDFDNVVVGHVTEVKEHPNADRLKLCTVDAGDEELQIVCGAPNVDEGQMVPVAKVGAVLPVTLDDGSFLKIRKAKIRGEHSRGMICAEDELGIGEDHSGIMVLDGELKPGQPFTDVIPPTRDHIIDIELTPNRPDASSHLGVARDIAAFLETELRKPVIDLPEEPLSIADQIDISIKNELKCHRYVGVLIKDVTITESPQWLQAQLKNLGLRPVNAIVDATNFVLHEMGQPLHAFDFDLLADRKIVVQDFDEEVEFETLDHVKRKVPAGSLFICDGEQPVAIAGVMGGLNSEINDDTTNVLLESAYFDPASIRRTSKQLGLQTDSSYRFERGIDPNMTLNAAWRCATMIAEMTGGTLVPGFEDVHPITTKPRELTLRRSYLNRVLGTELTMKAAAGVLANLGLEVTELSDDSATLLVPTFRPDLEREIDLVEEVGRIYDYNNIPLPDGFSIHEVTPLKQQESIQQRVKHAVSNLGFREIYTNSLLSEEAASHYAEEDRLIHTLNPISKDQAVLRTSMVHGFLSTVAYNMNRGQKQLRLFELGHVFEKSDGDGTYFEGYREQVKLSIGLAGLKHDEHWRTELTSYTVFDLKGPVRAFLSQLRLLDGITTEADDEHTLRYHHNGILIGELTRIDDELASYYDIELPAFMAEFSLDRISEILTGQPPQSFDAIPKYPSFAFDLALVVAKNVPAGDLMQTIKQQASERLQNIDIFDVFEGGSLEKGTKSIAFRLAFRDSEKTLTIEDVQPVIDKVLAKLESEHAATLRS